MNTKDKLIFFAFDEHRDEIEYCSPGLIWINTDDFPDTEVRFPVRLMAVELGYRTKAVTVDLGRGDYDTNIFIELTVGPTHEESKWYPIDDWWPTDAEMVRFVDYLCRIKAFECFGR